MSLTLTHVALVCALVAPTAVMAQDTVPPTTTPPNPSAQITAPDQERATTVTFTTATRLPGLTLEPGDYIFKLGAPAGEQNIVEVYSTDGSQKIGTFLTVDYAEPATGETLVLYPNSDPPALRAGYFPGSTVGRAFVYSEDEARTLYSTTSTPVLWASWNPNDDLAVGEIRVETLDDTTTVDLADAAEAAGDAVVDAADAVADATQQVWDDVTDNDGLVNPTESRRLAERELDAAEKTYDDIEDRLTDEQEAALATFRQHLEDLEDAFEKDDPSWMRHYNATIEALDALAPERPVGTSGGAATVTLDATTLSQLGTIRTQLRAFHEHAMRK